MSMDLNFENNKSANVPLSAIDLSPTHNALPSGSYNAQELNSLGLSEPLPPSEIIDEWHASSLLVWFRY